MVKGIVFDIKKYSLHDGPGIRTTVFLKGVRSGASGAIIPRAGGWSRSLAFAIQDAAKERLDHSRTGGTLLNMKFNPQVLEGEGLDKLVHLIRGYFKLDGHHIQFNVVDAETLRKAQQKPEKNRDLIVRVAGYSDYFVELGKDLQNEIIARTEQISF